MIILILILQKRTNALKMDGDIDSMVCVNTIKKQLHIQDIENDTWKSGK